MKHILLSLALALGACATGPTAYGPVSDVNQFGFDSLKIENDRFRVNYLGRTANEARDYALLRAAEISLEEGYSHFRVLGGETLADAPQRHSGVSTRVGISSGRGYYRGGTSVGVGINLNDLGRTLGGTKASHSMEIKLLKTGATDSNVYDAASVRDNIRPELFQ